MSRERKKRGRPASIAGDGVPAVPDPEHLRIARKVLFKKTKLTLNGVVTERRRIDHYMKHLAQEATRQRRLAQREIRKLREIRRLQPIVRRTTRVLSPLTPVLEKQERLSEIGNNLYWPAVLGLWPDFITHYEDAYGDLGDAPRSSPTTCGHSRSALTSTRR